MEDKRTLVVVEDRPAAVQRQTASFLGRLWIEPGEDGEAQALRGLVRNLQSGTEQGIADPTELGETLLRQIPGAPVLQGSGLQRVSK